MLVVLAKQNRLLAIVLKRSLVASSIYLAKHFHVSSSGRGMFNRLGLICCHIILLIVVITLIVYLNVMEEVC
jgi:hypothetical protein